MNASLDDSLRKAERLGLRVSYVRGTGEVRIDYPGRRPLRINSRRKDTPRALMVLLRQMEAGLER